MFFLGLDNKEVQLENFNVELAKQKLEEGYPVILFCCDLTKRGTAWSAKQALRDRIYDKLQYNLKYFHQEKSGTNRK